MKSLRLRARFGRHLGSNAARSARAARRWEKNKKVGFAEFGPPVQPETGPKIEFSKVADRRPDRSGLAPKIAHP